MTDFEILCDRCKRPVTMSEAMALRVRGEYGHWGTYHPSCADADLLRGWYPCAGARARIMFYGNRMPRLPGGAIEPRSNERPCT
jgi:hypothetical protein